MWGTAPTSTLEGRPPDEEMRGYLRRLVVAVALTIPVLILSFGFPEDRWAMWLTWILATPVVFYAGWPFFRSAARAARHGTTTMDTLVALGAADGVRLQRVRDRDERGGPLLRRRRGDRHVDPGRQDARGGRPLLRRRRGADPARTRREGSDGPGRRRRAAGADRGAAPRQRRGRPPGGEDPGRRRRAGRGLHGWTCPC